MLYKVEVPEPDAKITSLHIARLYFLRLAPYGDHKKLTLYLNRNFAKL